MLKLQRQAEENADLVGNELVTRLSDDKCVKSQICMIAGWICCTRMREAGEGMVINENLRANLRAIRVVRNLHLMLVSFISIKIAVCALVHETLRAFTASHLTGLGLVQTSSLGSDGHLP